MYLGQKSNKKPKTLGQKVSSGVYSLGSKVVQGALTNLLMKNIPKLLI